MLTHSSAQVFSLEMGSLRRLFEDELLLPPWLFKQHDLSSALESAKRIDLAELLNKINYIHFMGEDLYVNMLHPRYKEGILLKARPDPSAGKDVTCYWADGDLSGLNLESYEFQWLIICDGQLIIFVPATLLSVGGQAISLQLHDYAYVLGRGRPSAIYASPCERS